MQLSKHKNHRNSKYLAWLRTQKCAVSGQGAQCAHHIRLGTNGGTGIKPSDYFCIPLLNEYHVSGPSALHIIGEETFLSNFGLDPKKLFIQYLKDYLAQNLEVYYMLERKSDEEVIKDLIELIEEKMPKLHKAPKKAPKKTPKKAPKNPKSLSKSPTSKSLKGDPYYEKAKELKRERDKELRKKLKEDAPSKPKSQPKTRPKIKAKKKVPNKVSTSLKGDPYYERAKELKRQRDKEMRRKLKERMRAKKDE